MPELSDCSSSIKKTANIPPKQKTYTMVELANIIKDLPCYGKERYLRFDDVRNVLFDVAQELGQGDRRVAVRGE